MAIKHFIPEIWAAQMLFDFRQQALAAGLCNRQYEGEAQRGNTVHITSGVPVEIHDYKAAGRTTEPDELDDDGQELVIDQEKSFDFLVDDIDRRQAAGDFGGYTTEAGLALAEDADKFLWATAAAGAQAGNKIVAAAPATGNDAFDVLNDLGKTLNKALTPRANRVVVFNAEFEALLTRADSKITSVETSGMPDGLRNATIGRLLNFTLASSENLPVVDEPMAIAFYQPALAFVSQITETEAMRAEKKFADRLRGLHVYGGKVTRPKYVATYKTAGAPAGDE